jgi:2-polyprenyl-3-methyl-5-hydroxy-6-metoxy-1,4-benzoquinol methylase
MKNLHVITPILNEFESAYIKVRDLENRVYSDEEAALLPYSKKQENEWKLRAKSAKRFEDYLAKNHSQSNLLEIGCGNGWFSHLCSNCVKSVSGVDLNKTELEQAASVFQKDNLNFYYWNIFTDSPFENKFDVIVLNAVVQYFESFDKLLLILQSLLNQNGEIHFIDSPFYISEEIPNAKK